MKKLSGYIPLPLVVGFFVSIVASMLGFVFSANIDKIFFALIVIVWFALFNTKYKISASSHVFLFFLLLMGHTPALLIKLLF